MANKPALKTTKHTTPNNVEFTLIRKQVKNIGLKVRTTGEVQVTANTRVPLEYIVNLVDQKSDWINKHIEKFKNIENSKDDSNIKPKNERTYSTGEELYFLGKVYVLKVVETCTNKVYIENDELILQINSTTETDKKQQIIEKWYRNQCALIFQQALDAQYEVVKNYILSSKLKEKPHFKLRKMKSCWGVCHYTKGYIVLNTELIKYDMDCINYVVLHELMHFRHPNHSKDFYYGLSYFMPNYKEIKTKLKMHKY